MEAIEIEKILQDALNCAELHVKYDGSHGSVIAVSDVFADMSRIKKQQFVMAPIKDLINSGVIHAITIKTFTTSQWQREKMFNMPS